MVCTGKMYISIQFPCSRGLQYDTYHVCVYRVRVLFGSTNCIFNHANAVRCIGTDAKNSSFLAIDRKSINTMLTARAKKNGSSPVTDFGPLADFDKRTLVCER